MLAAATPATRRSPFGEGCVDAIPIAISFAFLFFAVGALNATYHYTLVQSSVMTALVFAAPLQVFILLDGPSLALSTLLSATLLINFRFLIMASVLAQKFENTPLRKLLLAIPLLSASTFTVSNARAGSNTSLFEYYVGVGVVSISVAIAATIVGFSVGGQNDPHLAKVIAMILPVHFAALTAGRWPQAGPIIITAAGFLLVPLGAHLFGSLHVILMPFAIAMVALLVYRRRMGR